MPITKCQSRNVIGILSFRDWHFVPALRDTRAQGSSNIRLYSSKRKWLLSQIVQGILPQSKPTVCQCLLMSPQQKCEVKMIVSAIRNHENMIFQVFLRLEALPLFPVLTTFSPTSFGSCALKFLVIFTGPGETVPSENDCKRKFYRR